MKSKELMLVVIVAFLVSAATCTKPPTPVMVCQDIPGPSLLEKMIPDLRLADTLFKLSVLQIGRLDSVKQKDVARVLDEADALLLAGTTYDGFLMYLLPKFRWAQKVGGAELVVIGEYLTTFEGIKTPIEVKDVCYLRHHISEERKKVLPWIL